MGINITTQIFKSTHSCNLQGVNLGDIAQSNFRLVVIHLPLAANVAFMQISRITSQRLAHSFHFVVVLHFNLHVKLP
jgi:hypothetical protein